jgi:hypothetical protein
MLPKFANGYTVTVEFPRNALQQSGGLAYCFWASRFGGSKDRRIDHGDIDTVAETHEFTDPMNVQMFCNETFRQLAGHKAKISIEGVAIKD